MADISKVLVGETQYDIKDETARGKVAGHVIKNASGTAVTQRANMQFKTAAVTDENGETVVRNVVQMTRAEYDLITPVDGVIYEITDETVTPSVVETVPIAQGGTGATTAAAARTNLGLGTAATKDSTTSVTDGGTGLPTSGAVYSAIDDVRTDLSDYHVVPSRNHMRFDDPRTVSSGLAVTITETSIRVVNATAGTYKNAAYFMPVTANTDYVIKTHAVVTSGVACFNVFTADAQTQIASTSRYSADADIELSFNSGTQTTVIVSFFSAFDTSVSGDVLYQNPLLYTAADYAADPSYEPNWETLKDSVEEKCDNSVIASVENGTTASKAYSVGEHFIRNGAYCLVSAAIASGATLTENTNYITSNINESGYVCRGQYNGDCDTLGPGIVYYGNSGSHAPFNWAIIQTFFANASGSNRVQIAYRSIDFGIAFRWYGAGAWSAWKNVTLT